MIRWSSRLELGLREVRWYFLLLLAVAVLPLVVKNRYYLDIVTQAGIYINLALGLNIEAGYAGLLDMGYAAFFAIGAYTTAILMTQVNTPFWIAVLVAAFLAAAAGTGVAIPTLRLRSAYLAIVTLGFGEVVRLTAINLKITGGATGIFGIPRPSFGPVSLSTPAQFYYLVYAFVFLGAILSTNLRRSRVGRAWSAIKEDEDVAQAMGINTTRERVAAFSLGAAWAGLTGGIYAVKMTAVAPESFTFMQSATILMAVVLGGMGSVPGVILGAALTYIMPELLRQFAGARMLVFGFALIVIMLTRPGGLWPARSPVYYRRLANGVSGNIGIKPGLWRTLRNQKPFHECGTGRDS